MILIDAETIAITGQPFVVSNRTMNAPTISAVGLAGTENVKLQHKVNEIWGDVYSNGTQIKLTATNTSIPVAVVGYYRVVKTTSAGEVSVELFEDRDLN